MGQTRYDVVVVGAGIIGACCALWAQKSGLNVLLVDQNEPGSGTSYGNACSLADYGSVPLNSPTLLQRLPGMMLNSDSPLRVDLMYAINHMPWMLAFLKNCREHRVREISNALGKLLKHTHEGYDPLFEQANAHDLINSCGFLNIYSTAVGLQASKADQEVRRRNGKEFTELNKDQILELEPALKMPIEGGYLYDDVKIIRDPQALIQRFVQQLQQAGGEWRQVKINALINDNKDVMVIDVDGNAIHSRKVVISSGAFSKQISGSGAEDLPLDTERGYHILYKDRQSLISRAVGWAEGGFYATPMNHGLRLAGTVEIAGLEKAKTPARIDYLKRRARMMFSDLNAPDDDWIGFRPTMPDSLPVIGYSHRSRNIIFAFGHQHLGLTLGGITGKIVASLAIDQSPDIGIEEFSPQRFTT